MHLVNIMLNSVLFLLVGVLFAFSIIGPLHMFQQNRYEMRRYAPWLLKHPQLIYNHMLQLIGLLVLVASYFLWPLKFVVVILLLIIIKIKLVGNKKKYIKPLVYTQRVKRQITAFTILLLVILLIVNILINTDYALWVSVFVIYVFVMFVYVFMFVVAILMMPVEKYIQKRFINLAKQQLVSMPNLKKIGITGSYGKTSSKHILNDVLSASFYTLMTPASYNTPMGITLTIREQLSRLHEVFIIEMGADKVGEIKYLAKMTQPQYGVVTSIGPQHLNTFKSLDNIIKEKMQLIELLPHDGIGILNIDDNNIANYKIQNECQIITYAIINEADFKAVDIQYSTIGSSFKVVCKKGQYDFQTKLLGEHNIYNILSAIALADAMGVDMNRIQKAVSKLNFVPHRLELKKQNGLTLIDNAFNSNPSSARMSLEVLSKMPGFRIVCTPGMIDLGNLQKSANYEFGKQMLNKADYAILVGKQQTAPIYKGLIDSGFDKAKIKVCDTVQEAFVHIHKIKQNNTIVLLENDLPDAFNE